MQIKDLIWTHSDTLPKEFCEHLIQKFEQDDRKEPGWILVGLDPSMKTSTDLFITGLPGWEKEDQQLYQNLSPYIQSYIDYCNSFQNMKFCHLQNIRDIGYQIQRTKPGEYYNWHDDFACDDENGYRVFTFIWYLNDIVNEGYTEFVDGTRIQPETGKLLIFPATWTYVHRGYSPKTETKYICTGWVYSKY